MPMQDLEDRVLPPRRVADKYLVVASGAVATNVATMVQTIVSALKSYSGCSSILLNTIHDDQLSTAHRPAGRDGPYHITKLEFEVPSGFKLNRMELRAQILQGLNRAKLNGIAIAIVPSGLQLRSKKLFTILHHDDDELHASLKKLGKVAGEKYNVRIKNGFSGFRDGER
jgi:hypothetical protein